MSTLPKFEDLKKELSEDLAIVQASQRDELVHKIRRLIGRKLEFERTLRYYENNMPKIRESIRLHKKVFTQLVYALTSIENAKKIAEPEDPMMLKDLGVIRAQKVISAAVADIRWFKDVFFPASIHPDLQKGREVGVDLRMFKHMRSRTPGFGKAKVDHWLMRKLDESLDDFVTPEGKTIATGRDKLIRKVFEAAFDWSYEIKTINAVCREQRKKRSKAPQKLREK